MSLDGGACHRSVMVDATVAVEGFVEMNACRRMERHIKLAYQPASWCAAAIGVASDILSCSRARATILPSVWNLYSRSRCAVRSAPPHRFVVVIKPVSAAVSDSNARSVIFMVPYCVLVLVVPRLPHDEQLGILNSAAVTILPLARNSRRLLLPGIVHPRLMIPDASSPIWCPFRHAAPRNKAFKIQPRSVIMYGTANACNTAVREHRAGVNLDFGNINAATMPFFLHSSVLRPTPDRRCYA